ncbi:MAG TPA: hypothetical protein VHE30_11700 [Polyangiaceae bacterium]|nr:hypothetical protein [Polyangiaceae bacterium]
MNLTAETEDLTAESEDLTAETVDLTAETVDLTAPVDRRSRKANGTGGISSPDSLYTNYPPRTPRR